MLYILFVYHVDHLHDRIISLRGKG